MNKERAEELILEITRELADPENIASFVKNMDKLPGVNKNMRAFEWWETYLAWSEVGYEEDMENYYDTE